jgi:AcrR family transcriptional regulator
MNAQTRTRTYSLGARATAMEATRTRILEAALGLWRERWYDDVTLADVAAAGGVSVQTLLNHFGGKAGLVEAVADWATPRVEAVREAPAGDVRRIVAALFDDYEVNGEATFRWNAEAARVPALASVLARARESHRAWLERVFADRLPARGATRERALSLHYAATDVYLWKLWRVDLGLSRPDAERAMRELLAGIDPRRPGR